MTWTMTCWKLLLAIACWTSTTFTGAEVLNSDTERTGTGTDQLRVKREVNREMTGFNQNEKLRILWKHNDLRSSQSSSDMMYLEWDEDLTKSAQEWAEYCRVQRSVDRYVPGYQTVGENIYAVPDQFDPADIVQMWFDEVQYYNYQTRGCSRLCGHYTLVVWATVRAVGCGVKYCPVLEYTDDAGNKNTESGYNIVCHYGPGGNFIGEWPYTLGKSCSKCPLSDNYCIRGLCSKRPKIGADEGSVVESRPVLVISLVLAALYTPASRR